MGLNAKFWKSLDDEFESKLKLHLEKIDNNPQNVAGAKGFIIESVKALNRLYDSMELFIQQAKTSAADGNGEVGVPISLRKTALEIFDVKIKNKLTDFIAERKKQVEFFENSILLVGQSG